jgi:hypothetical protein
MPEDSRYRNADHAFASACREWIKGCSCSSADNPADCEECTHAFLDAVLTRAQCFGLEIGANSIGKRTQ